ncbi:DUF3306 domain-containing protein [Massilia yuzhufengensis]|nr:DUF3306 domain-containing protein [Massilia yuzhufengensis]
MPDEGFLRRWARLKSTGPEDAPAPIVPPAPMAPAAPPVDAAPIDGPGEPAEAAPPAPLPTMEDAERLTPGADFSAFVAKGVDKSVHRLALKKLFTDPHFNVVDGLDIYMSDYNIPSPLTPAMLASLQHAQGLVARLLDDQQKAADELAAAEGQLDNNEGAALVPAQVPRSTPQGNA